MPQDDNNSSESDWFDKDEDELVEDLKAKTISTVAAPADNTEYIIAAPVVEVGRIALESNNAHPRKSTVTTAKLRELAAMTPIDSFLYVATLETNFFTDQIAGNDSMERVLLYMRILVTISSLELPGYYVPALQDFVSSEPLLQQLCGICHKLFGLKFHSMWSDMQRVDELIADLQHMCLCVYQEGIANAKWLSSLKTILRTMEKSDATCIAQRSCCLEFKEHIQRILEKEAAGVAGADRTQELLPTPAELIDFENQASPSYQPDAQQPATTAEYIASQKQRLREDFLLSLRASVQAIKTNQNLDNGTPYFNDVQIMVNEDIAQAQRSQLLFVDIMGSQRTSEEMRLPKNMSVYLSTLKTGALLCLSSSCDFDNIIYAVVTNMQRNTLLKGYISIEILQQYNIGAIYERSFIMFESAAFFEPYNHVFNVLKSHVAANFPMDKYIVAGEQNIAQPTYLKESTTYNVDGEEFRPLSEVPANLELNLSQQAAFKSALSQEFCLVQGPPGTGKTHLSVQLVNTLLQNERTPIIVLAYTNESLDKFILKLSKHTKSIVRFGGQSRDPKIAKFNVYHEEATALNPLLKRLYYVTNLKYKEKFENLQKLYKEFDGSEENYQLIYQAQRVRREVVTQLNTIHMLFKYYTVRGKEIVAMTTTCAAKTNFLFMLLQSAVVILEEAAEILESHVVACLTRYTKHVIMIGDHQQLKPYTANFQHSRTHELNVSLFERLIKRNVRCCTLGTQYRMRPEICDLLCPTIYASLENAEAVLKSPPVKKMQKNLFFLSHEKPENKNKRNFSLTNKFERKKLLELAEYLVCKSGYRSHHIVILSPYARHVQLIEKSLRSKSKLNAIKVTTVDSFQGLEADIVLLSLVRSNSNNDIGFLREKNRICVTLSRAKHGLYIIGNMSLLAKCSSTWKLIEEKLQAQNAIGSEFPYAAARTVENRRGGNRLQNNDDDDGDSSDSTESSDDELDCFDEV